MHSNKEETNFKFNLMFNSQCVGHNFDDPTVAHGKARETTKQTWLRARLEVDFSAPGDLDFSG